MLVVLGQEKRKSGSYGFIAGCGRRNVPVKLVKYSDEDKGYDGRKAVAEAFVGQEVPLLKRRGSYVDNRTNERKFYTNFYLQCGDDWIPVEVEFQPNEREVDVNYGSNKRVFSAYAEALPPKFDMNNGSTEGEPVPTEDAENAPPSPTLQPMKDDSDIPF